MTELERQWKREENMRWMGIFILFSVSLFLGLLVIAHSIQLLGIKCSL